MEDLTTLEQSLSSKDTTDMISTLMFWLIVPSIVIGIFFVIAFTINSVRRWRMEQAIFEIRDLLRDMKQNQTPAVPLTPLQSESTPSMSPDNTADESEKR